MIHINRNRENLGKFSEQEVADGLKSGRFLPGDLAWRDPMPTWEPLSTFTDLPEPSVEVPPALEAEVPNDGPVEPAWERSESGLSLGAAFETVRQIFSSPAETFRRMQTTGGFSKPMAFYLLLSWASGVAAIGYQALVSFINPEIFLGDAAKSLSHNAILVICAAVAFLLPIFLIIGSFLSAATFHLGLMIVGAAKKPFEVTYRAVVYASGATSVLQFIPLCGGYLYMFANFFYVVIALREAHQTETWRIVLGSLIMFLFCCGIFAGAAFLVAGMAGGLGGFFK
jgi:hypothetical protein